MRTAFQRKPYSHSAKQLGFTLTELLVALALGLFLIGGVVSLFVSNQGNFKTNENLSRLQESARFAVEQLSREIRDAGTTPCGIRAINSVIREDGAANTSIPWWADWNAGVVRGFDSNATITGLNSVPFGTSTAGLRVNNTDGIITLRTSFEEEAMYTVQSHNTSSSVITLDRPATRYANGQALMMCDGKSGAIFHLTGAPVGADIEYLSTAGRNCSTQLGWTKSVNCNVSATYKQFEPGAFVTKYDPAFWYVGYTGVGDATALYRATVVEQNVGGNRVPNMTRREMVPDVSGMQIEYLTRTNPTTATGTAVLSSNWVAADHTTFDTANGGWSANNVNEAIAVRVTLTLTSKENVGTNTAGTSSEKLSRQSVFLISLRNREIVPTK